MPEKDEKSMLLQAEAFDKYDQECEELAVDLLTDQSALADSKEVFWQTLEAELKD